MGAYPLKYNQSYCRPVYPNGGFWVYRNPIFGLNGDF